MGTYLHITYLYELTKINESGKILIADYGYYMLKKCSSALIGYKNKTGWTAPEQIEDKAKSIVTKQLPCNDVYSFGIIMWEVLTQLVPFDIPFSQIHEYVVEKSSRPLIPTTIDLHIASIIRQCWQKDYMKRPTISELLEKLKRYQSKLA
jgi:serine/threonine protein kinase